jgi:hypothetical protein
MPETGRQAKDPECKELDDVSIAACRCQKSDDGPRIQVARSWIVEALLLRMPEKPDDGPRIQDARSWMM